VWRFRLRLIGSLRRKNTGLYSREGQEWQQTRLDLHSAASISPGCRRSAEPHDPPAFQLAFIGVPLWLKFHFRIVKNKPDLLLLPDPLIEPYGDGVAVLSIDLAFRLWSDLGIVVLDRVQPPRQTSDLRGPMAAPPLVDTGISCEIITWNNGDLDPGTRSRPVNAEVLAGRLNHLCNVRGIRVLMLDGPQAWKSRTNGLEHARVSERQLNTACKTGLPGMVKPITYRKFAEFCLDVYDALSRRGWRRLATREQPGSGPERVLVESYPCAAWKSLGLRPLPSKRRARVSDLAEAFGALRAIVPLTVNRPPNHDQLQAIVGGLPGLALAERDGAGARIIGAPPRREDGHWREGFIVLPVPPRTTSLRWMN
jgi:hypothetical protein